MRVLAQRYIAGHHVAVGVKAAARLVNIAAKGGSVAALDRHPAVAVDFALRRQHCTGLQQWSVKFGIRGRINLVLFAVNPVHVAIGLNDFALLNHDFCTLMIKNRRLARLKVFDAVAAVLAAHNHTVRSIAAQRYHYRFAAVGRMAGKSVFLQMFKVLQGFVGQAAQLHALYRLGRHHQRDFSPKGRAQGFADIFSSLCRFFSPIYSNSFKYRRFCLFFATFFAAFFALMAHAFAFAFALARRLGLFGVSVGCPNTVLFEPQLGLRAIHAG